MRLGLRMLGMCMAVPCLLAETLGVRYEGDSLTVTAPGLDILQGAALEKLKNGGSMAFDFHLALWVGDRSSVRRRAFERFIVSYDLWEEKYSVTGLRKPPASAARLSAKAVPAWCLEHIALPAVTLTKDAPFWVRLEIRAVEKKDAPWTDDSAVSLSSLIELLSGSNREEPNRWSLEAGPLRLAGLQPAARP